MISIMPELLHIFLYNILILYPKQQIRRQSIQKEIIGIPALKTASLPMPDHSSLRPSHHSIPTITQCFFLLYLLIICRNDSIQLNLCSQCTAIYILNCKKVKDINCSFVVDDIVSKSNIGSVYLGVSSSLDTNSTNQQAFLKRVQIFNQEPTSQSLNISLSCSSPLPQLLVENTLRYPSYSQAILLTRPNIENYILPFNLVSEKTKKIIIEQSIAKNVPLYRKYQPFLDTYWNQHSNDRLLLSWLPYFSRCQHKTSGRIYISDVVEPWINYAYDLENVGRICNSTQSWFWGQTLQCEIKKTTTKCVLQEMYLQKTKKTPWWNNKQHPIFYFVKPSIISSSLLALDNVDTLASITEQYYDNLIALQYQTYFNLQTQTPNKFTLYLKIGSISDLNNLRILKAELKAYVDDSDDTVNENEAKLEIYVEYLSSFDTLVAYGKDIWVYVGIFGVMMVAVVGGVKLGLDWLRVQLHFWTVVRLIIFPIVKGFCLAFFLCTLFLVLFFVIAALTKYKAIAVDYDNKLSNDWNSYAGRVGLSILLVGYFLLSIGISQSFKVLTPQQTKNMLQDAQTEKSPANPSPSPYPYSQPTPESSPYQLQNFIINNMSSHRKYLSIYLLSYTFLLLILYYAQLTFSFAQKIIFIIFGYPFIHKITIIVYRHIVVQELLYLSAILITLQVFLDIMIISDMLLWESVIFYVTKLVTENVLCIVVEIGSQWVAIKIHNYIVLGQQSKQGPTKLQYILQTIKQPLQQITSESRYQKTFFYTNLLSIRFAAILTRPFLIMLILMTVKYNYICRDLHQNSNDLIKSFIILICLAPIDVLVMTAGVNVFESYFGLQIFKCLQFNRFKFNKRKGRWINDLFHQGRSIQHFYRQFEKFCFSSQMYLMILIISFSLLTMLIGFKIIIEVNYVSFVDPAMIVILIIVWFIGNISSVIISFAAIKLKIYERKQDGKMRAKLQNVQKILKKSNYSEYLQTDAVKTYFLYHCKQWIIANLTKIFDKEDFTDNNYEFLIKYKNYKSLLKKKKIEQRKLIQGDSQQKSKQILSQQYKDKKLVIKLPRKDFEQLARPLLSSWLYIAKQFVYLKSLVSKLKQTNKRESCELCSMNIELQVIEKKQFASLVNQYRVLNIGRIFLEEHFIKFYQYNQQYITLCVECKDRKLYIEKKNLDVNGSPRKLLQKWLIIARSNILHRRKSFDKSRNQ